MHTAIGFRAKFLLIAILLLAAFVLLFLWHSENEISLSQAAIYLPKAVAISAVLASLLGHHSVIDLIWRCVPRLNQWVAPNLNGVFQVENRTNWPTKKRLLEAPYGKNLDDSQGPALLPVSGELRIRMGLLHLKVQYTPGTQAPSRTGSTVISASLRRDPLSGAFELIYVYFGTSPSPEAATDEQHYYGCAILSIPADPRCPNAFVGKYWTNRMYMKGLNTAGELSGNRM